MKKSCLSHFAFAVVAALSSPAFADQPKSGRDRLASILTDEGVACLQGALRTAVKNPAAELAWTETATSDGAFSKTFTASSLGADFVLRGASVHMAADSARVRLLGTAVEVENTLNRQIAAFSIAGLTHYFDNPQSLALATASRQAEASLHNEAMLCLYKRGDAEYSTEMAPPVPVPAPRN